jgi:hypothetical protein
MIINLFTVSLDNEILICEPHWNSNITVKLVFLTHGMHCQFHMYALGCVHDDNNNEYDCVRNA